MEKMMGTIKPVFKDKKIESIEVKAIVSSASKFKITDIQLQEGENYTQYNNSVSEKYENENNEIHFNFMARGFTTLIIPYMSEVPYDTSGKTLPCETDYITTPVKTDILIHKEFNKNDEVISIGPGITGKSKRFELQEDIPGYTHCVYDGYTSKQYIDGTEKSDVFIGRELRLANADCKYTVNQDNNRKTTGVLYANKTKRREKA